MQGGIDSFLVFTVLILVAFGLIMVFSASYADAANRYGDSYYYIKRQSVMVVIGLIGMVIASRLPLWFYKSVAVPAYGVSVLLFFVDFNSKKLHIFTNHFTYLHVILTNTRRKYKTINTIPIEIIMALKAMPDKNENTAKGLLIGSLCIGSFFISFLAI